MSKTTVQDIQRAVRVDEENRFALAGRILAHAEILREDGETGDASLLARLAEVVALHGAEYGRGWIQGAHHTAGVRIHGPWMIGAEVLEHRG